MSNRGIVVIIAAFLILGGLMNSFFIIDQTQQALVLRFGKPVNIITEPGLKFKVPFVDAVEVYDRRILVLNADPKAVILQDQDRLIVDAYVTYRIKDPLTFYQAVRSERIMNQRLEKMLETSLREVMGREDLSTLLSPKRSAIMDNIRNNVSRLSTGKSLTVRGEKVAIEPAQPAEAAQVDEVVVDGEPVKVKKARAGFGIEIVDVRIMRTDLPKQTSDPIYNRMRSDRQKVAEKFRAEGAKESQIIRSEADKERTIMIADAERQSAIIRGQGDGKATGIFAESFGQDPQFFEFYRSMEAYKGSLSKDDTTVILSPDNNFLKFLER